MADPGGTPFTPKKPTLAPASPQPSQGNAIAGIPLSWHQMLVSALVIGISIWLVEQNVDQKAAFILALIILLGVAYKYTGFANELQAIVQGKA